MVGLMKWYQYTGDDATVYGIKLDESNAVALGFEAVEAGNEKVPSGLIPRLLNLQSKTTTKKRRIPVPATDSDFWNGTNTEVTLNVGGAVTEVFSIQSWIGERRTNGIKVPAA